jgi:hypothetical protein
MSRSIVFLCILAALAVAASAMPQEPRHITGCVVDVLGRPIVSAQVTATVKGSDDRHASCNDLGCFAFTGLGPGECRIRASAPGYRSELTLTDPYYLERPAGKVRIQLLESDAVQGQVRADDGTPLTGALVVFLAPDKYVGDEPADHAWTDAYGHYWLPDVPIGEVRLTVIANGYDLQEAIFVVDGPTIRDFTLRQAESASYRITITGASPEQWSRLQCQLRLSHHLDLDLGRRHWVDSNDRHWDLGELWPHDRTADTITYAGLPTSLRIEEISIWVPHGEAEPRWHQVPPGGGIHEVSARIVPDKYEQRTPIVVTGTVHDPAGRPVPGQRIAQEQQQGSDAATTDGNGVFSLSTTANGNGFFSLHLDGPDYVIHAEDLREAGRHCERNQRSELAIVADRAAHLTGVIVDHGGKPVFDAEVLLIADEDEDRTDTVHAPDTPVARIRTGPDGAFSLDGLDAHMARNLWLRVTSSVGPNADTPVYVAGPWHLTPGQHLELGTLTLPSTAGIEGTIVDDEGKPRCGIEVCLFRHGDSLDLWKVYTDRLGRYACSELPAGDYSVNVDSPHSMHSEWPDYARVTLHAGERVLVTRARPLTWLLILGLSGGALLLLVAVGWRACTRRTRSAA